MKNITQTTSGRHIVWGLSVCFFMLSVLLSVFFAILSPEIQQSFALSHQQIAILTSVFFIIYALMQFLGGYLLDKLGFKRLFIGCLLLTALGLFILSQAQTFLILFLAKVLTAGGLACAYMSAIYLARVFFGQKALGFYAGLTQTLSSFCCALTVIVISINHMSFAFRQVSIHFFWVIIFLAVVSVLLVPSINKMTKLATSKQRYTFLSYWQYWVGVVYFASSFSVLIALADLWAIPYELSFEHSLRESALLNAMFPLGSATGALLAGLLNYFFKRLLLFMRLYLIVMLVCLGAYLSFDTLSTTQVYVLIYMLGVSLGGSVLAFPFISQRLSPSNQGIGLGVMMSVAFSLSACWQYLIGWILDKLSQSHIASATTYQLALSPLIAMLILTLLMLYTIKSKTT